MDLESLVGTIWDAKNGSRSIRIERAYRSHGINALDIINLGTRRTSYITLSGLKAKFRQRDD